MMEKLESLKAERDYLWNEYRACIKKRYTKGKKFSLKMAKIMNQIYYP